MGKQLVVAWASAVSPLRKPGADTVTFDGNEARVLFRAEVDTPGRVDLYTVPTSGAGPPHGRLDGDDLRPDPDLDRRLLPVGGGPDLAHAARVALVGPGVQVDGGGRPFRRRAVRGRFVGLQVDLRGVEPVEPIRDPLPQDFYIAVP